ncbi:exocyst complex component Sec3p [Monosporozyma servazzii]
MKKAISPFKRKNHSRESSKDESHQNARHSQASGPMHKRTISGSSVSKSYGDSAPPPVTGSTQTHKRNTSRSSNSSQSSNFLAEQYERDRRSIISSCFSRADSKTNSPPNSYMTHVRVIEDAKYPSSRPGPDSKLEYKKKRVLIVSSLAMSPSSIQIHKARENPDGSFQIGRTWNLRDLTRIEKDTEIPEGFMLTLGKRYYWETNSAKERTVFAKTLVKIFLQVFEGHVPELVNWDLALFYLDESSYERAVIHPKDKNDSTAVPQGQQGQPQQPSQQKQYQAQPPLQQQQCQQAHPRQQFQPQAPTAVPVVTPAAIPPLGSPGEMHANLSPTRTNMKSPQRDTGTDNYNNQRQKSHQPLESPNKQSRSSLNMTPYSTHTTLDEVSRNYSNKPVSMQNTEPEPELIPSPRDPRHSLKNEQLQRYERESHPYQAIGAGKADSDEQFYEATDAYPSPRREEQEYSKPASYDKVNYGNDLPETLASTSASNDRNSNTYNQHQDMDDNLMDDLNAMLGENIESQRKSEIMQSNSETPHPEYSEDPAFKEAKTVHLIPSHETIESEDELDLNNAPTSNNYEYSDHSETHTQPLEQFSGEESIDPLQSKVSNDNLSDRHTNKLNENGNDLSFEAGDEVRYSQTFDQPPLSPHQYHEVTTIEEEDHSNVPDTSDDNINTPLINSDQKTEKIDISDEVLLEALTDVNWEVDDDADQLIARLESKLEKTEHTFNKDLLALQNIGSFLKSYEENVDKECSKMNPAFSLYLMDLNNLAQDIDFVERQDNGFQVESANKKLLWSTLADLLNTVSLDEATLNELLKCPIRERNLPWMETQLSSLSKALKAINGETNDEENDLRDMEAMRRRHTYYEKVTEKFLGRLVDEMGTLFSGIKIDGTNEQMISTLQRLLVYAPLISFCKEISSDSFNTIVENWNKNIQVVYNGLWSRMYKQICQDLQNGLTPEKGVLKQGNIDSLLHQWQHFKQTREVSFSDPLYLSFLSEIFNTFNFIQQHCIIYQNFVNSFFHIKSQVSFTDYVAQYSDPSTRVVSLDEINRMDSDRESASIAMSMVAKIFQPIISELSSFLNELAKINLSIQPSIMIILEEKAKLLESSNQEFLFTAFKRLFVQLQNLWTGFMGTQSLSFERILSNEFNKDILPPVFGFPLLVKNIGDSIYCVVDTYTDVAIPETQTYQLLLTSYSDTLATIMKLLNERKPPHKISSVGNHLLNETTLADTITLLSNYNWLIEFLTMLNTELNGALDDLLQSCKETFDNERIIYAGHLLQNSMPKLKSFIDGATHIDETNESSVSVSQWGAYSRQNLEIILNAYTSEDIRKLVSNLYKHMLDDITIDQPEIMHIALRDKVWSSLQGKTVSLCLKLYTLVDKHYRGVQIKFNKNDIIGSFEQYKE